MGKGWSKAEPDPKPSEKIEVDWGKLNSQMRVMGEKAGEALRKLSSALDVPVELMREPQMHTHLGPPPESVVGYIVGDTWFDTTAGELWKVEDDPKMWVKQQQVRASAGFIVFDEATTFTNSNVNVALPPMMKPRLKPIDWGPQDEVRDA